MQRRLLTNGSAFKRTDNRWGGVVWYMDEHGERKRKSFSGTTKAEVNKKMTDYITDFENQVSVSDEAVKKLQDSMQSWLEVFKFPSVEQTAYDRCECSAKNQIYPMLGEKPVGDITAADIKNLLNCLMNENYAYTMRNTPKKTAGNLVKYMATREGVEKVPVGTDVAPSTVRQQRLIKQILKIDSEVEKYPEYQDYLKAPMKNNATEFIDAFIERNADRIGDMKKIVEYMANRPGVEKLSGHGLFSQTDDKIDLKEVANEVGRHQGIIWTHVISLRREDAERLGYNSAQAWKDLVRRNVTEIAQAQNIDINNLKWYGAFHNTTHHPHMHLLVYSKDEKQGWLTKKSIDDLRNAFGNDIFRNEQYKLFTMETDLRNRLKEEAKYDLYETAASIGNSYQTTTRMTVLFRELVSKLQNYSGRKQYGYLPADIKDTVNKIVSELAKDNGIAELYDEWSKVNREKLSLYYDKKKAPVPLEDNKEFRSIKNMIVKAAVEFTTAEISAAHTAEIDTTVKSFVSALVQMITQSYKKKIFRLNSQIDGKLKSKIEQKKQAHGLKTDRSVQTDHSEDEEQGFTMNM